MNFEHPIQILHLCQERHSLNPLFCIVPKQMIGDCSCVKLTFDDFTKLYCNSNYIMYTYLQKYEDSVSSLINGLSVIDFLRRNGLNTIISYLFCLSDISTIYYDAKNSLSELVTKTTIKHVLSFNTINTAFYNLMLEVCGPLPILGFQECGKFRNSSRAEYILCMALIRTHKCKNIFSACNNDGKQKHFGKLSLDFYCETHKEGIFCEGLFKYECEITKHNKYPLSKRQLKLIQSGVQKRAKLNKLAGHAIKTFTVCEQCIFRQNFTNSFLSSSFYSSDLSFWIKHYMAEFDINTYKRLNPHTCILPPITFGFQKQFDSTSSMDFLHKFDLKSAYISTFLRKDILLPTDEFIYLVHQDANKFFCSLNSKDQNFGLVRASIAPTESDFPFAPFHSPGH